MISVVIITKNEEDVIRGCLESIKWADEILVVDSGSDDRTLEIVRKYTINILKLSGGNFSTWRNEAMKKAKGEWVLYVDADERITKQLQDEIRDLVRTGEKSAYAISRINIIFGQEVSYGPYKHDWMIRLFKKSDFKTWVGEVHEHGEFVGELGYSKESMLHFTHRSLDTIMYKKTLPWSKIDAKLRFDAKHPKMTGWRFLRIFFTEFFNQGINRRGFFGGTVGVVDGMLSTFSMFLTYVRLWEMQQSKPLEQVYRDLDKRLIEEGFNYP